MRGLICAGLLTTGVFCMAHIFHNPSAGYVGAFLLGSVAQILAYPPRDR